MSKTIVLASSNLGKFREIQQALESLPITLAPQSAYHLKSAEETGNTFVENAILKARFTSQATQLPAIADDSGLIVPGLGGKPGIYSSRFAGIHASDQDNINKLLHDIHDIKDKRAFFYCVIVLLNQADDPTPLICEGHLWGDIILAPQGETGFGYDPVFYLKDKNKTTAELDLQEKNQISHRGQALKRLKNQIHEKLLN